MNKENKELSIRDQYTEKKETKMDKLVEMDKKVKTPARAFAYALGTVGALTLGAGMSFAMKVIGGGWSMAMPLGIVVGCIGIAIVSGNYFLYKKVLANRKKKYSGEILALSEEILNA